MNSKVIVIIVETVVLPLAAFLVRMARGEFRNEHERVVSDLIRSYLKKFNITVGVAT